MFKRVAALPVLGVLVFLVLYFYSASLYPIATSTSLASPGYDHLHHYWCDLYVPVTPTGHANPARPYAMVATLVLTTTLMFFFLTVTALFMEFAWLCLLVRCTGTLSMGAASGIFTPFHDLLITFGVPLGVFAIIGTCVGLGRKREWSLMTLAILAITVSTADYLLWKMQILMFYQPMIQKAAFALFFLWILVATFRVLKLPHARTMTPAAPALSNT